MKRKAKDRKMKIEDFRLIIDLHYPNLQDFVVDFNSMGGQITLPTVTYHLEYPHLIDEGWRNAYNLFFANKFMQELILANSMVQDKVRLN